MIKVNSGDQVFEIQFNAGSDTQGTINGEPFDLDLIPVRNNVFHLLKDHQSHEVHVIEADFDKNQIDIDISGERYKPRIISEFDELLKSMGMDKVQSEVVKEVKAPMPGLVSEILVQAGTEVQANDNLLVLEAMKMENMLKSPTSGVIKTIKAKKGKAVEKNEILIIFE